MQGKPNTQRSGRIGTRLAACGALALALYGSVASAVPPSTGLPTINYWRDACEVAVHFDDPSEMQRVIDATVFIVDPAALGLNPDGSYYVRTDLFDFFDGRVLGTGSHFYGEQKIIFGGLPGRSGFLTSPDTVVTSPHVTNWNLTGYYVLFGYENTAHPDGSCTPIDLTQFPASQVRVIDGYVNGLPALGDYLVAHLSEPVLDRPFLRVRRDGHAEIGDEATVVGHPARLSKKIDTAGRVVGMSGDVPRVQPLHTINFSSGSPLYNLSRQYVELAVAYAGSCATYICSGPGGDQDCSTWDLVSHCPATPGWLNQSIKPFAAQIEPIALEVTPLSTYRIGTSSGGFTQPLTTYTLSAPAGGTHSSPAIDYRIDPPEDDGLGPYLQIVPPLAPTGSLAAGQSLSFDVEAVMPPGQTCGIFPREFLVHDLTHGFTDRVSQTLEVGYTAFTAPTTPILLEGIEQPYPATHTLTIGNLRSTPVSVRVAASTAWLKVGGDTGSPSLLPQTVVTIPGGQTASVTIGLGPTAVALPLFEEYKATITLASVSGVCNLTAPIPVPLTFRPGVLTISEKIDASVPPAPSIGLGAVLASTLNVTEQFCIGEVRASYLFDHPYGSYPVGDWLSEAAWRLQRPDSKRSVPLWEGQSVPVCTGIRPDPPSVACYLYAAAYADCLKDGSERSPECQVFTVGDARRPVPVECAPGDGGCENLADLSGKPAQGVWETVLADQVVGGISPQPTLAGWSLTFRGSAACSP